MKENIKFLDSKNFDSFIRKGNSVVDFWAEWCGPCKIMAPHFEAAAKELSGKVGFGKVDVESEQELAERFQIMSIPTTIFFKDGEMVERIVGAVPKDNLMKIIKESF